MQLPAQPHFMPREEHGWCVAASQHMCPTAPEHIHCLLQLLPAPHTCCWTRTDRQKGGWAQWTGIRGLRTSVVIYRWEF